MMTASVQQIAEQVKSLQGEELEEFLAWLAEYELEHADEWDREIERDCQPGGRLESVIKKARREIAEGKAKPLDEIVCDE